MTRAKHQSLLTNLELAVMKAVWAAGGEPLTVREVAERINRGRRRPLAYTTIQTILSILRDKRVVDSEPGPGRAHRFRARVSREAVTNSMVGDLVERLFDGRVQPLLVELVGHESLSREELTRLRDLIERELDDEP